MEAELRRRGTDHLWHYIDIPKERLAAQIAKRNEAVLRGEYLEVRLIQSQVVENDVRALGVDDLAQVFADDAPPVQTDGSVRTEFVCEMDFRLQSGLFQKELQQGSVELEQSLRL